MFGLTLFRAEWYHRDVSIPLEDRQFVEKLIALAERCGLSELSLEQGESRIVVRSSSVVAVIPASSIGHDVERMSAEAARMTGPVVPAPIMGVFYRSPAPGEPPFVEPGDTVEVGQPIGMIEAMKVFSEVLAEQGGRVRRVVADNGALVQPGDALVELEAS